MSRLDRILTLKHFLYATSLSIWQLIVGVIALGLAYGYIEQLQIDRERQDNRLEDRAKFILADLQESFCRDGQGHELDVDGFRAQFVVDSGHEADRKEEFGTRVIDRLESGHGATVVLFREVDGLTTRQPFVSKIGPEKLVRKLRNEIPREDKSDAKTPDEDPEVAAGDNESDWAQMRQNLCSEWSWEPAAGSINGSDGKTWARTSWAKVDLGDKAGAFIVFIEEEGPLEGWPRWIAFGIGASIVVAVLWVSVVLNNYLHSRVDRLEEFGRRMSFVLHDLRHNLERIRSNAKANKTIDPLARELERLIEDGRLIANTQQEPASRVDLYSLLATAAEDINVEMDCPDGLIVRVPPRNFGSAITNLLHNAEEHGSSDRGSGTIELGVSVRRGKGWSRRKHDAVITIADNGPGTENRIERSENIRQAIDRLQHTRDTNRRRGLGLLSVLYTVRECGGRFALLNREDGKSGTLSEIVLPVKLRKSTR